MCNKTIPKHTVTLDEYAEIFKPWVELEGDMEKTCETCKHHGESFNGHCFYSIHPCHGYSKWEPVAQPDNTVEKSNDFPNPDDFLDKKADESGPLDESVKPSDLDNYAYLEDVLTSALKQASHGKGNKRHACGEPFEEQLMLKIEGMVNSFTLGQAIKKQVESERLEPDAAIRELYGAIVYIAGRIIYLETQSESEE